MQNSSAKSAKKTLDAPLLTDKTTSLKQCFTGLEFISTNVEEPYMSKNYKEFIELHGIRKLVKICGKDFEPWTLNCGSAALSGQNRVETYEICN